MNTVAHPLLLQLAETTAHGREISLRVAGYEIRGQLALTGAGLDLHGRDGTLSAERLVVASVTINGHGVRLSAQQLEAAHCTIGWGHAGLRVEAASLDLKALQVIGDDEPLEGSVVLEEVSLVDLAVHRGDIRVGRARITGSEVDAKLPVHHGDGAEPPRAREPASDSTAALLGRLLPVLDRLSGRINVDLGLDLAVPVIGRRRATHPFRIPIDAGTIDFRKLEDNLSALEDSLLDFSVRDEGLVLEVGIPLIPTRGKGKPIVTWPLDAADHALAQQQRVRLSVLAKPNLNGRSDEHDDNADNDDKSSPVALRKAALGNLEVTLAVAPLDDSPIRRVGSLMLVGDVTHRADPSEEATPGALRGEVKELELGELAIGNVSLASLRLDSASDLELGFDGSAPAHVRVITRGLHVEGLYVASRNADAGVTRTRDGVGGEHAHVPHAPTK